MRTLTATFAKIFSLAAAFIFVAQVQANEIELRFATAHVDASTQELYVDIEVQYTQKGQLILAGQNYRFYYDSEVLELDASATESNLPSNSYGELTFDDHKAGIAADHVNQLVFDDNLGFVNFSINLSDVLNGGLTLTEDKGWVSIATLKFDIKKAGARYDLVWGREGVSDLYATAFVEVAQWVSSTKLDVVNIASYGDLTSEEVAKESIAVSDVSVGPNPTADYVNISFDSEVKAATTVIFRDMNGRQMKRDVVQPGSINSRVDLSDLTSANYMVEVYTNEGGLIHNTQVVVAK